MFVLYILIILLIAMSVLGDLDSKRQYSFDRPTLDHYDVSQPRLDHSVFILYSPQRSANTVLLQCAINQLISAITMNSLFSLLLASVVFVGTLYADRGLKLSQMHEEQRLALVIGNKDYTRFARLKNPVNDAKAIRDALEARGFSVMYFENADKRTMDDALTGFGHRLKRGGVGLFFFAGHGMEVDGKNYLVPIGASIRDEVDVKYQALALNEVIDRMEGSSNRLNLVLLDACRNNPFKRGSGGLAPMGNAKGMLIAYATAAGGVADDGYKDDHGVFTRELLRAMDSDRPIEMAMKQVREGVYDATGGRQWPYVNNGIIGDFFFVLPDASTSSSSVQWQTRRPDTFSLSVQTDPEDATVRIMNIKPSYHKGIRLKAGEYALEVSKTGYYTKTATISLHQDRTVQVTLEKAAVAPTQKDEKGVYTDPDTGLMWQDEPYTDQEKKAYDEYTQYGKTRDWSGARNYCADLVWAGYSDWRLPDKEELRSLLTSSKHDGYYIKPALVEGMPPLTGKNKYAPFWSSTTRDTSFAWYVHFDVGIDHWVSKSGEMYVRCVRVGQ